MRSDFSMPGQVVSSGDGAVSIKLEDGRVIALASRDTSGFVGGDAVNVVACGIRVPAVTVATSRTTGAIASNIMEKVGHRGIIRSGIGLIDEFVASPLLAVPLVNWVVFFYIMLQTRTFISVSMETYRAVMAGICVTLGMAIPALMIPNMALLLITMAPVPGAVVAYGLIAWQLTGRGKNGQRTGEAGMAPEAAR